MIVVEGVLFGVGFPGALCRGSICKKQSESYFHVYFNPITFCISYLNVFYTLYPTFF